MKQPTLRQIAAKNAASSLRDRAVSMQKESNEIFVLLDYLDEVELENRSLNDSFKIIALARGE